jgi:tetratricopeptide (TPR) repeat protein
MHLAMSNIRDGNDAAAEAVIDKLLTKSTRDLPLAEVIWNIVQCYCDSNQPENAQNVYLSAVDGWPEGEQVVLKQMIVAISNIHLGNDVAAQAAIDRLKDYKENIHFNDVMIDISGAYYTKGIKLSAGKPYPQKVYFKKSLTILEDNSIWNVPDDAARASINYVIGLDYLQLADYQKAADAFQRTVEIYPQYQYADYCVFAVGSCYEKIADSNSISQADAKPFIESQYTRLIKNYPQSSYAPYAKTWLQEKEKQVKSSSSAGEGAN